MNRFQAEVVDIRLETSQPPRWQVLLTHTDFSPASPTGSLEAVAPSGARLEVPVLDLVADGADLWHIVAKPLAAGTPVTGTVACQIPNQIPQSG